MASIDMIISLIMVQHTFCCIAPWWLHAIAPYNPKHAPSAWLVSHLWERVETCAVAHVINALSGPGFCSDEDARLLAYEFLCGRKIMVDDSDLDEDYWLSFFEHPDARPAMHYYLAWAERGAHFLDRRFVHVPN